MSRLEFCFFSRSSDLRLDIWPRRDESCLRDLAGLTFIADMFVLAKANLKNMLAVFGSYRTLAFTPVKLVGLMVDFMRLGGVLTPTFHMLRLSFHAVRPYRLVCLRRKSR